MYHNRSCKLMNIDKVSTCRTFSPHRGNVWNSIDSGQAIILNQTTSQKLRKRLNFDSRSIYVILIDHPLLYLLCIFIYNSVNLLVWIFGIFLNS